jgi:hypothetical protein
MGDNPRCPRCRAGLLLTHDIQRTNRIVYHRCPDGHGRFTTFFQFLREKSFVRDLSKIEIDKLKATVAQVRCSSCGAPIDLARDAACSYCHAPISILDPDAVNKALAELTSQAAARHAIDPARIAEALTLSNAAPKPKPLWARDLSSGGTDSALVDLVAVGLSLLLE